MNCGTFVFLDDHTYEDCVSMMRKFYGAHVILTRERTKFFTVKQEENQSLSEFGNQMRQLAVIYHFDTLDAQDILKVQFINRMKNERSE